MTIERGQLRFIYQSHTKNARARNIISRIIHYNFSPLLTVSFGGDTSTTSSPFATACCC